MSEQPKLPVREIAALTLDTATGLPIASGLLAAFDLVGGFCARGNERRAQHAFDVLVDEWAAVGRMPPEEAEIEVRRLLTEGAPEADDQLHEAFRKINAASSGASWPYIARMTATYLQEGRPSDNFFRRCGWLLERCVPTDIEFLQGVLATTRSTIDDLVNKHGVPVSDLLAFRWNIGQDSVIEVLEVSNTPHDRRGIFDHGMGHEKPRMVLRLVVDACLAIDTSNSIEMSSTVAHQLMSFFLFRRAA